MIKKLTHLTLEDRHKIKKGLDLGLSYTKLAAFVSRGKATVLRESKRLGNPKDYDPEAAQKHFEATRVDKHKRVSELKKIKHLRLKSSQACFSDKKPY